MFLDTTKKTTEEYVSHLLQYHELLVLENHWSEELRQDIIAQLAEKNIHDLIIYRRQPTESFSDYVLCIDGFRPSYAVVKAYPERSFLQKSYPILILVMLCFLFTGLTARKFDLMLSFAFLVFNPICMGAICQYVLNMQTVNSLSNLFKQQLIFFVGVLIVSVVVLREGTICVIMASPLIYGALVAGAAIMRAICIYLWKPTVKVYSLAMLPLLALFIIPHHAEDLSGTTKRELIIQAPQAEVFRAINNIQNIKDEEIIDSPIFTMGFPKPMSGMTENTDDGLVRQIYWQRGIHFQEKVIHSTAPNLLSWTYLFDQNSFPKGSLDDHVEIGGQYFDLLTTDYRLEAISPTQTKLILTIDYRLTTEINWYAKPWADYVLNEFSDVVLNVYKHRLEKS